MTQNAGIWYLLLRFSSCNRGLSRGICFHYWSANLISHRNVCMGTRVPSVLWHCWLDVRKSIRPVKIEWWGVDVVICLERGADCLHIVQLMPLHPKTPSSLVASFKSRLVQPFWYRLTQVVLEKRPLNGCCCCCMDTRAQFLCSPIILGVTSFPLKMQDRKMRHQIA